MIYFLVYLFLEVFISVNISSAIGALATFVEIIASAILGFAILINFKSTLRDNFAALASNVINFREFERLNIFTIVGAILLILPGFLTDIFGILLQFSAFTKMIVNHYGIKYKDKKHKRGDNDVIDVEIISDSSINK